MIVIVGAALALGIAGIPSTHHDTPVHAAVTTTTVLPSPPTSGSG